ncbi:Homeobox protein EgHBX4 [Taenia solium]|eukprot:TsM_001242200 transcript=TsM_001242200 gene=TsM_001242200
MPPSQRAAVPQLQQQCRDYRCQQPSPLVPATETPSQQTQQPRNLSEFEPEVGSMHDVSPRSGNRALGSLRRKRKIYTREELRVLEAAFAVTMYPDLATCDELAARLDVESWRIRLWFKNRRFKYRNESQRSNSEQSA